jgi:hypothetical protein
VGLRLTALVASVLLLTSAAAADAQTAGSFRARLSPVPIDTPQADTITGTGSATAVLKGSRLTVAGRFEGLKSPATVARLHRGPKGIRGPAVFDLTVSGATSGTVAATLDLTPAQIEDLRRERFYIQLHSQHAPEGNLWGWLLHEESRR